MSEQPKRIQRRRTRGWKMPPNTKSVTRPGKFGNQFVVINGNRGNASRLYEAWLRGTDAGRKLMEEGKAALRGFNLACFCPLPNDGGEDLCHAAVWLRIANEDEGMS